MNAASRLLTKKGRDVPRAVAQSAQEIISTYSNRNQQTAGCKRKLPAKSSHRSRQLPTAASKQLAASVNSLQPAGSLRA